MGPEALRGDLRRSWETTGDVRRVVQRLWQPEGKDGRAHYHCKPLKPRGKDPAWSAEVLWAIDSDSEDELEDVVVDIDWEPARPGAVEVSRRSASVDLFCALPAEIELAALVEQFCAQVDAARAAGWKIRELSVGG